MSNHTIARRYAQALLNQAESAGSVERMDPEVLFLAETLRDSRPLRLVLQSPIVALSKKQAVFEQLLSKRVSKELLGFVRMTVEKRREALLPEMLSAYLDMRDVQMGIVTASVKSAHTLDDQEQVDLRASLEKLTGQKIRMEMDLDDTLIGGVVVQIGDMVYDRSVKRHLTVLRERFERGGPATLN